MAKSRVPSHPETTTFSTHLLDQTSESYPLGKASRAQRRTRDLRLNARSRARRIERRNSYLKTERLFVLEESGSGWLLLQEQGISCAQQYANRQPYSLDNVVSIAFRAMEESSSTKLDACIDLASSLEGSALSIGDVVCAYRDQPSVWVLLEKSGNRWFIAPISSHFRLEGFRDERGIWHHADEPRPSDIVLSTTNVCPGRVVRTEAQTYVEEQFLLDSRFVRRIGTLFDFLEREIVRAEIALEEDICYWDPNRLADLERCRERVDYLGGVVLGSAHLRK